MTKFIVKLSLITLVFVLGCSSAGVVSCYKNFMQTLYSLSYTKSSIVLYSFTRFDSFLLLLILLLISQEDWVRRNRWTVRPCVIWLKRRNPMCTSLWNCRMKSQRITYQPSTHFFRVVLKYGILVRKAAFLKYGT